MGQLIERGMDAPHPPHMKGDAPIFKEGRLIGVKRRIAWTQAPVSPNSRYRLLVVDDTRDMADLLSGLLTSWGFQVMTSYDAASGLEKAQATVPDLILLNYLMPALNGLQVMQLLRADSRTAGIKIIIDDVEPIGELAFRMGADDFLMLPFKTDLLLEKVLRAVRR